MYHHFDCKNRLFLMRYISPLSSEIPYPKVPCRGGFCKRPLSCLHCLGHISVESILKMAQSGMAKGMDVLGGKDDISTYCKECEVAGHTQSPIPKETFTRSNEVLRHVFSDVCE